MRADAEEWAILRPIAHRLLLRRLAEELRDDEYGIILRGTRLAPLFHAGRRRPDLEEIRERWARQDAAGTRER